MSEDGVSNHDDIDIDIDIFGFIVNEYNVITIA
eukprot:COSAG02_NODE_32_length_50374_cov_46.674013_12_plen_33_part_00